MGQRLSCSESHESGLLSAVRNGELEVVEDALEADPSVLERTYGPARMSLLHVAAECGRIEVLCSLLDRSVDPDVLNSHKQTPLMLAAMNGKIRCVQKLIEAGANVLMFDSPRRRTCLHYVAYYGHSDCLQVILSAALLGPVADSWGFARFVNIRDGDGATPLHLAARRRHPNCVHTLLENGALVCAGTGGFGHPGSTPLHFAARSGSLECVRELLAWGADRLLLDSAGRIPYSVAQKHKHEACAAILNPSSAEPLVWPSPLKLISELNPEAKVLLERALVEANMEREKAILKGAFISFPSPLQSDAEADDNTASEASDVELCCICFDQACTIEVQPCNHQMCAHCTLALCCHKKPNPAASSLSSPLCPFCRTSITQLLVAKTNVSDDDEYDSSSKPRRSSRKSNFSEGSSSFKSLSALGSLGRLGVIGPENFSIDKPS